MPARYPGDSTAIDAALGVKHESKTAGREMADDSTTPVESGEPGTAATTPAEAKNTDTATEPMIPKSRLDDVLKRAKELERALAERSKSESEAEKARLAEQNRFKELYEQEQATRAQLEADLRAERTKLWQQQAATEAKLPPSMAARLRGETLEDLLDDAKALAAELPRPFAPNTNGAAGDGGAPRGGQTWWEAQGLTKEEAAARLNLNPKYM